MKKLIWNRHTKLLLKHIAGWLCIVLGVVMLVTPGQGIITILIGIYLLADHVPFFGRLKKRLQDRFPKTADFVQQKTEAMRERFHKNDSAH